jgi:hypothetical protein
MTSTASQASAPSIDLYDQDRYSIPDDELSSGGSSTISSADDATDASMDMDGNSRISSKKTKTVTKNHKFKKPPVNMVFDPHAHGLPSLHGQSTADVSKAVEQVVDEDQSDSTSSSYRRRVPLTTLTTAEDFNFGDPNKQNRTAVPRPEQKTDRITTVTEKHIAPAQPFTHHAPTGSVPISKPESQSKPTVTPILPNATNSPEAISTTFYTYRAQLTFGLPPSTDGVNVAKYFRRWVYSSY